MKTLALESRPVPLTLTEHGVWRVTGTRIPLERVVAYSNAGYSPEAIVEAFDTLRLSDVYAVISYYLDHKNEVEEYVRAQEEKALEIQRVVETAQPRPGLREELLARKARMEGNHAPTGE